MFNRGGGTVRNVAFKGNFAVTTGGGVFGLLSGVTMTNVTFSGNLAASGGGMSNVCYCPPIGPCIGGCPTLTNVVFSGNSALGGGGGMFNWGREWGPALTNVTFSGNSAATGGAMYNEDSQPTVTNCILWDNIGGQISSDGTSSATVSYSLVQGGYPGTSNIDADPHFADSSSGVYHLLNCSPAIGAGTLDGAPLTDIEGNPRPDPPGSNPDMGAYENPLGSPQPVAAFTASPLSGRAPLDVQFTDQSCGDIDTWNWEFGDGGVSASQNPTHTFTTADAYTVTLTASGPGGSDTETKPAYIVVQGYRIYLPIVLRQSP